MAEPYPKGARSKAQFRMLQAERNNPRRMTKEQAEAELAPPLDPELRTPIKGYYQHLPDTAAAGPSPYWLEQMGPEAFNELGELMQPRRPR